MVNNIRKTNKLIEGIKLAVNEIRPTYGNYGTNSLIETEEYPFNKMSNDAYTIIHAINTDESDVKQGLNLLKELMDKQNSLSGDGRKTTAIMAETLLDLALKSDIPKIQLKKLIDNQIQFLEEELKKHTLPIEIQDIYKVANVSSESDELAQLLQEIYTLIGKDGVIEVESSNTPYTSYKFIEGTRFTQLGYISPVFVNDEDARKQNKQELRAIYENPKILITKQKINSWKEINPILKTLISKDVKTLVILATDIDNDVAGGLIQAHKDKHINILILKPPVMWRDGIIEDFAKCTGTTVIDKTQGYSLDKFDLNYLGTCDKIISTKDDTTLLGIKDISEHIKTLKETENLQDNENQLRAQWLSNKTVILKIGGYSDQDIYYKRMKCQDAINSCKSALEHGVVVGSGLTLKSIAESLKSNDINDLLKEMLLAPYNQLCLNANKTITNEDVVDIYDSALVIRNAIRNAIGQASSILSLGSAYPLMPKTAEEIALLTKRQF